MTNRDRLAALLDDHRHDISAVTDWRCVCGWINSDGSLSDWNLHLADALIAAGVTVPASPAIPGRAFTDDHGRRWEWCGGVEGTWAWRITALPAQTHGECR